MAFTIDGVLESEFVTVIERNDDAGLYCVRIGTLATAVTIELRPAESGEMTEFVVSHAIHTPTQAGPYRTSLPFGDYPAYALHKAISGLTSYYRDAVRQGHQPSEDWLVQREH